MQALPALTKKPNGICLFIDLEKGHRISCLTDRESPMTTASNGARTVPIILATALLTLLGTVATPLVTWLTEKTTLRANTIKYCQARVDADQATLRARGEAFLLSVGQFDTKLKEPMAHENFKEKNAELGSLSWAITEGAWRLGVYAPPELTLAGIELATGAQTIVHGKVQERTTDINLLSSRITNWINLFRDSNEGFNKQRIACESDVSFGKS